MRIYEGSPRQDWEEVLRSIGGFVDREQLKEILLLEMEGGFLLQGLAMQGAASDSDSYGSLAKRTYELTDEQVAQLMDERAAARGTVTADTPHPDLLNYYELSMRVLGAYIDGQRPHDVFLLEQEGSYVVRLFAPAGSRGAGHRLAEFTRDEMLAMIHQAPEQRGEAAPPTGAAQAGEQQA